MRAQLRETLQAAGGPKFQAMLLSIMDRKDHPSYWHLMSPGATREQLLIHYRQEWGAYVRDFPRMLSSVHARCPEPDVRSALAENLYEEETGGISGGGPHAELFLHMMGGLGFPRRSFEGVRLLPRSRAYRDFLDRTIESSPWVVALSVVTIFVEGSRNDRAEVAGLPPTGRRPGRSSADPIEKDPLVVNHGLEPRFLELKRVHRKVEGDHRLSAWRAVLAHARTAPQRARVATALERALVLWLAYRDGVARAAGLL